MSASGTLRSVLAAPAVAQFSAQSGSASTFEFSSGRLGATLAAGLGLIGVVVGGLALARRPGRPGAGSGSGSGSERQRRGPVVALAAGLIAVALGGLVVVTADGGVGTGNGLGGAVVALVLGLIAISLGALARFRVT